jgi:hypothetical protein
MSRSSFARSVARAAASGGGKAYKSRRPTAWYLMMAAIVVLGSFLVVYSRNEALHPHTAATEGPSATDHWYAAYAIDLCGAVQPNLPANTNLSSVGIRTFGAGLIDINPGASTKPANFEGKKATLGLFASSYPTFTLTSTSIKAPGKLPVTWANGSTCTGPLKGKGTLVAKVWSSPTANNPKIVASNITGIHLTNGQMITIAFVPSGASIPAPPSRDTLITTLGGTVPSSATTTTTASATTTTTASATTTTTASATTTTTASATTTTSKS